MTASTEGVATQLSGGALAGHWTLDPARSTISLRAKSFWGLVTVKGRFGELSGEGEVTADGHVSGRLSVASASVDTGNAKRDTHLRSDDFFSADRHPAIIFDVSGVDTSSAQPTVGGTLTVREQSQPLSFPVNAGASDGAVSVDATVTVDRTALGLTWNKGGMVGRTATMDVHAVFTRG
jgi:polyisoprenoid-binding protein YceI